MTLSQAAVFESNAARRAQLVRGLTQAGLEVSQAAEPDALRREQLVIVGPGVLDPAKVARAVRKARPKALVLAAQSRRALARWADARLPLPLSPRDLEARLPELAGLQQRKAKRPSAGSEAAPGKAPGILDPRTSFYTFAHFREVLYVEVKRARRYGFPLSVALMAIDPLSTEINPTLRAQLLGGLALAVRRSLRDTDYPVQYGERRVLLLMPHTPLAGAVVVAQRIRERVARAQLPYQGQVLRPTLSVGLAGSSLGPRELSFADLARQAQKSLLSAIQLGGNRVDFFDAGDQAADDPSLASVDFEPTRY
jgi:diguanylate cyclase (GGDEF)-like protein